MALSLAERVARTRLGGALLDAVRPLTRGRKTVKTNKFDDSSWKTARATEKINTVARDLLAGDEHKGGTRKGFEATEELLEGVYHLLYKANPKLTPARELERDLFPVTKILEDLAEHPRISELHDFTYTDEMMSILSVAAMQEVLQEIILRLQEVQPPGPPGQGEGQDEGQAGGQSGDQESSDQGEQGDQEGQSDGQSDGQGDGQGDGSDDAGDQAEADWEEAYGEALEDLNIDGLIDQGVNESLRDMGDLDARIRGIGIDPGEWEAMSPEQRLRLAEWLSTDEMRELADMIGWMKRHALDTRRERITDVPLEAYDVEFGDNLTVTLQSEFALLSDPYGALEFYRRFTDQELMQFKRRGVEAVQKGPIVCCIDKTGSMAGKPIAWAIGIAEALRRFAADDSRDFYAIYFSSNNAQMPFHFPEGKGSIEQIIAFLSVKHGGGTQFDGVLEKALKHATTAYDEDKEGKADIVFITDGNASLSDDWIDRFNAERARLETQLISVFVSGADDVTSTPLTLLQRISDLVIPANYLKPSAATEVFRRV